MARNDDRVSAPALQWSGVPRLLPLSNAPGCAATIICRREIDAQQNACGAWHTHCPITYLCTWNPGDRGTGTRRIPASHPTIKEQPTYKPYRKDDCNFIYNLLFCDDGRAPIGAGDDAPTTLRAIADDESQEGRNRMWAYNLLREKGESVTPGILLGVVVEVALEEGRDVLAAFSDGSVRYINRTESLGFFEGNPRQIEEQVQMLLEVSQSFVQEIGPWTEPRLPPPPAGEVRITFLVSDGLYFGEGPYDLLRNGEMGWLVITAAEALLQAVVQLNVGSKEDS